VRDDAMRVVSEDVLSCGGQFCGSM